MTQGLFITLTDSNTNKKVVVQTSYLVSYTTKRLESTNEETTVVYLNHEELSVIFVHETLEELTKKLTECYLTVKG